MYLTQGLHRSVQQTPNAIATVDGARSHTFAELGERVARLAGGLRGLGVVPGDRVAHLGPNSDRFLQWYLALAWLGAVAVPVNTRWTPTEIAFSLTDSGTRVLVVDDSRLAQLGAVQAGACDVQLVVHAGDGPAPPGLESLDELASSGARIEDSRTGGDTPAGIFYTGAPRASRRAWC